MDEVLKITKFNEFRELSLSFTRTHQAVQEETVAIFENMFQQVVRTANFKKDTTFKVPAIPKTRNATKTVPSEKLDGSTAVKRSSRLAGEKTVKESVGRVTRSRMQATSLVDNEQKQKDSGTSTNVENNGNKNSCLQEQVTKKLPEVVALKDVKNTDNGQIQKQEKLPEVENVNENKNSCLQEQVTKKLPEVVAPKDVNNTDNEQIQKQVTKKLPEVIAPLEQPDSTYCISPPKNYKSPLSSSTPNDNTNPKPLMIQGTPGSVKKIVKKFEKQCKPQIMCTKSPLPRSVIKTTPLGKKTVGKTNLLNDVKKPPRCVTRNTAKALGKASKQPPMAQKSDALSSCENVLPNKKGSEQCIPTQMKKDQNETLKKKEQLVPPVMEDKKRVEKENAGGQQNTASDNYNIEDIESGDSTDDEYRPKKAIPRWAEKEHRFQCAAVDNHITYTTRIKWYGMLNARHRSTGALFPASKNQRPRTSSIYWPSYISYTEY